MTHEWLICLLGFIFGIQFGSFATMASYRVPRGEDIIFTPSHCPKCNSRLHILDLFPIFSWLCFWGKCRYCKAKISPRYPLIETSVGLYAAALCYAAFAGGEIGISGGAARFFLCAAGALPLVIAFIMLSEGRRVPPGYYYMYHAAALYVMAFAMPGMRAPAIAYAAIAAAALWICPKLGRPLPALRLYAGMAALAPLSALALYANGAGAIAALALPAGASLATALCSPLLRPAELTLTGFLLASLLAVV